MKDDDEMPSVVQEFRTLDVKVADDHHVSKAKVQVPRFVLLHFLEAFDGVDGLALGSFLSPDSAFFWIFSYINDSSFKMHCA